ncbi:hypothetical protein LJC71_09055 [Desulfosarcina sp. OttesenSCG-928-A07]|nr:hypothetical protein [Desulfosarcina sp. OttesenSCG-928-G17]MDL2329872.1 hypothetical protein [Desulfosarcina sp. OttesenSCG-928-A07]
MWTLWILGGIGGYIVYGGWESFVAGFTVAVIATFIVPLVLGLIGILINLFSPPKK